MSKQNESKCLLSEKQYSALQKSIHKEVQQILSPPPDTGPAPIMKALRALGVSTVVLADCLGVGQSTAASYMNGIRRFPLKHEEAAYALLECAIEVATEQRSAALKTIPPAEVNELEGGYHEYKPSREELILDDFGKSILDCENLLEKWKDLRGATAAFKQ